MIVITATTVSGINTVKFKEKSGNFYWILNTGSTTIYASTKENFSVGDDEVVSIAPKDSRRLDTPNDTIYILGEGQAEIHNQKDAICPFKVTAAEPVPVEEMPEPPTNAELAAAIAELAEVVMNG